MRFFNLMLFMIFALNMVAIDAHAATYTANQNAEFGLNRATPNALQKYRLGSLTIKEQVRVLKGTYDFTKQGGAIGTVNLLLANGQPAILPNNAIVVDCIIDALTTGASASGTMALSTGQTGADLKAATAAASYTGRVACIPVGTAATALKMTADRTMTATIATGAFTAGKFNVMVQYIISD